MSKDLLLDYTVTVTTRQGITSHTPNIKLLSDARNLADTKKADVWLESVNIYKNVNRKGKVIKVLEEYVK